MTLNLSLAMQETTHCISTNSSSLQQLTEKQARLLNFSPRSPQLPFHLLALASYYSLITKAGQLKKVTPAKQFQNSDIYKLLTGIFIFGNSQKLKTHPSTS